MIGKYQISIALIVSAIAVSAPTATAKKVYIWTDNKGVTHVTDRKPSDETQGVREETVTGVKESPEERRRRLEYEQAQRIKDAEWERSAKARANAEGNRALGVTQETAPRRSEKKSSLDAYSPSREELETRLARYKHLYNNASGEYYRLYWKECIQATERQLNNAR